MSDNHPSDLSDKLRLAAENSSGINSCQRKIACPSVGDKFLRDLLREEETRTSVNDELRHVAVDRVPLEQLLGTENGRAAITAMAGACEMPASQKKSGRITQAAQAFVGLFRQPS